jgi:protein-serine/threonine kinase
MKVIRKSDMLRNSQEGHLRAERDFLVAAEGSRWVVPLIASFQDLNNLYLIMDYMPGGDFLGLLIRDNVLTEPVTKWYIAEMILCIEEAHALRWIHRDVKPDNFLISASGHLKISDFGLAFDGHWSHDQAYFNNHRYSLLAKLGINIEGDTLDRKEGQDAAAALRVANAIMGAKHRHERHSSSSDIDNILNWRNRNGNRTLAKSVVGTSQYMAPEVVRGDSYDGRCDWWSVAVILYEVSQISQNTKKIIVNLPKMSSRESELFLWG